MQFKFRVESVSHHKTFWPLCNLYLYRETLSIQQNVVIEIPMKNILYKYVDTTICVYQYMYKIGVHLQRNNNNKVATTKTTTEATPVTSSCNKKKYIQKHIIMKLKIDSCVYCRGVFDNAYILWQTTK